MCFIGWLKVVAVLIIEDVVVEAVVKPVVNEPAAQYSWDSRYVISSPLRCHPLRHQ